MLSNNVEGFGLPLEKKTVVNLLFLVLLLLLDLSHSIGRGGAGYRVNKVNHV